VGRNSEIYFLIGAAASIRNVKRMSALKKSKIEDLCHIIARNVAYYSVVHAAKGSSDHFWRTVSINFIHTAILDWCKIFVEEGGKHHWKIVVPSDQHAPFFEKMISSLDVTEKEFSDYAQVVKIYRNQFVAHMDESNVMPYDLSFNKFPDLKLLLGSTRFLYVSLHTERKYSFDEAYSSAERSARDVVGV
jgi:hypothetical protein